MRAREGRAAREGARTRRRLTAAPRAPGRVCRVRCARRWPCRSANKFNLASDGVIKQAWVTQRKQGGDTLFAGMNLMLSG